MVEDYIATRDECNDGESDEEVVEVIARCFGDKIQAIFDVLVFGHV